MRVSSRFITFHDSRERKCHLGTLLFKPFTFFISRGKCCACKSQARWAEFHFGEGKLLSTTRNHHLHGGVRRHCSLPYTSSGLTSPFTLRGSDKRWANARARACVLLLVCMCVCGKAEQEGSWGIQSLTQRSRDRQADTLRAQNNPGSIHEWNDRITGVLENLLRWLIMLFMVGCHAACGEKVKLFG